MIGASRAAALAAAAVLGFSVLAQQTPGASQDSPPPPQTPPALSAPGFHQFQIKQTTPAEHEALMQARAKELAAHPAQEVPLLPEQRIAPVAPRDR